VAPTAPAGTTTAPQLPAISADERAELVADLIRRREQLQALDRQLVECLERPVSPMPEACRGALAAQRNLIARQLIETVGGLAAITGDFSKVLNQVAPTPAPAEPSESGG
jgi:hypothetical protein